MIRTVTILAATAALAGCISGSDKQVYRHDFTLVPAAAEAAPATPAAGGTVLRLNPVSTPDWLAGTSMYYRLRYADDNRIRAYGQARWVAPPAAMLTTLVDGALAGSYHAVLGPEAVANADYTLSLRLTDLEQLFSSTSNSDCRMAVTATLIDDHGGDVVGQRTFAYRHAAPSADAAGGVACLHGNAGRFAADLKRWLSANTAAGSPTSQ